MVVWHTVHPLLVAVAHPRVQFTRIPTLTTKSTALTHRCPPASRKVDLLTIDRIRGPPAAQQLKRHGDPSLMRSPGKRLPLRVQLSAIVPGPRQIARIPKLQSAHWNATPDQAPDPIFAPRFRGPIYAVHVLSNHGTGSDLVDYWFAILPLRVAFPCEPLRPLSGQGRHWSPRTCTCGTSLEEFWETQSSQRKLQLFRCRKRVKIPGKLQLS